MGGYGISKKDDSNDRPKKVRKVLCSKIGSNKKETKTGKDLIKIKRKQNGSKGK